MTMSYLPREGNAIQLHGDHYVVKAPDGTREKVPLHRPDIALHIASGALPQSATHRAARPCDVPARLTSLTQTDVDVIGDVLSIAFRARDERIAKLELASGALSTADGRPARATDASNRGAKMSGRTVRMLARAAVGQARAALALSR